METIRTASFGVVTWSTVGACCAHVFHKGVRHSTAPGAVVKPVVNASVHVVHFLCIFASCSDCGFHWIVIQIGAC